MNNYPWIDDYLLSNTGATKDFKEEWQWFRYQVGGKLFAATCQPDLKYKGYDNRELLSLKCDPMMSEHLRSQYPDIVPGFYMDKQNWISIFLDGSVPEVVLRELCSQSYALVFSKLTKKLQREIRGEAM